MTVEVRSGFLFGELLDDQGRAWPIRRFPQDANRGTLAVERPNLVLHTTETDGYVEQLRYPSQWQCGAGVIGQHIRLGWAGDALNTWDRHAQQIEMVGRTGATKGAIWLAPESTLGPTIALVAYLHRRQWIKTGLARPRDWPTRLDRGPFASEAYYRRHAGAWPASPGVYGHVDIPENSHWDPGSWDYPTFFRRVAKAIVVQREGEADDMTPEEKRQLNQVFAFLDAASGELGLDEPRGTIVGNRVGAATKAVEDGLPGDDPKGLKRGDTVTLT